MSDSTVRIFIGSSKEGLSVAANLQAELEANRVGEVDRWDHDVFEPSGYTLDSLLVIAAKVDFAVLIASPDDIVISRGIEAPSIRDNILLEFGLFAGALGRERTYLLATGDRDLKLPTDVLGLTRLPYNVRTDGNLRAAVNDAALRIHRQVRERGSRKRADASAGNQTRYGSTLDRELELLCSNAQAQGWQIRTNSITTLRLRSPRGKSFTLAKRTPDTTRSDLRRFAADLRAAGLRVNSSLRRPIGESPL